MTDTTPSYPGQRIAACAVPTCDQTIGVYGDATIEHHDDGSHTVHYLPEPQPEPQLAMIDGRDALVLVLVKPGSTDGMVAIDAHCNGLDKLQAAKILAHVARQWKQEAEATACGCDGDQKDHTCGRVGPIFRGRARGHPRAAPSIFSRSRP